MSLSNSFSIFIVRVIEKSSSKNSNLSEFDGITDLKAFLYKVFSSKENAVNKIDLEQRAFSVEKITDKDGFLSGLIKTGLYGFESGIVDTETGLVKYKKKKTDADITPFYWAFYIPKNSSKGMLITQNIGNHGILDLVKDIIQREFSEKFQNHSLCINTQTPMEVVKHFCSDGQMMRIFLIKHTIPSDIADRLSPGSSEQQGSLELAIRPRAKNFFKNLSNRLVEYLAETDIDNSFIEFPGFEYDEIKADIKLNGRTRKVRFSNPKSFRFKIEIDDEEDLKKGVDGYLTFDSLNTIGKKYIKDLTERVGILS
ncbi:MAG: hypothetical protein HQM01_02095 [Magnetococcales bacterium]|nr:hypothetical protein [Magnetococcales bacterium]